MTMKSTLLAAIFTTVGLGLVVGTATNTHAKNRPTVSTVLECFEDSSTSISYADNGELISSCCYDDGCWICNAYQDQNGDTVTDLDDCVWDQSTAMPVRRYPVPTVGSLPGAMTGNPPRIGVPVPPRGGGLEPPPAVSTPPNGAVGVYPVQVAPPVTPPRGTVGVYPVQVAPPVTPPRGTVGVYPVQVAPPVTPPRGTIGVYPVQVAPPAPPRGTIRIPPVQVIGVKQSGTGGQPVTIFARGRASSATSHPSLARVRPTSVRAYATKQPGAIFLAHAASYGRRR
jgi:hypothetical protein